MKRGFHFVLFLLLSACKEEAPSTPPEDASPTSRPIRQGFTQRPARDTPGLPPPSPPLLMEEEIEDATSRASEVSPEETTAAERDLLASLEAFEADPSRLTDLRTTAIASVKAGLVPYRRAEAFHEEYLFPNDVDRANAKYQGKPVVLTGSVAPLNMLDPSDGFKLFEQEPYVHQPVLLATDYEFSFLRCRLARPEAQELRDWQEIHILGIVVEKKKSDVFLERCVVL